MPMSQEKTDIKCPCCESKTVAKKQGGTIFVWCKKCKKEVEINNGGMSHEPTKR